jgi:glutamate/tyrosine decarboxylase-like PLP-dependent enzyme
MSYLDKGKEEISTISTEVEVRVDPDKLRRKIDSKLDLMMGKIPTKYTS